MPSDFFLSQFGLELATFVDDHTPENIPEVDSPKSPASPKISPYHREILEDEPSSIDVKSVYVKYKGSVSGAASTWFDVSVDTDGDATIDLDLSQDMLDATKFWLKMGDSKLLKLPFSAVKVDSDGDVRIITPAPKPVLTALNLKKTESPRNMTLDWAFGKLLFRKGKGFYIFQGKDWFLTTIFDGQEYEDGIVYEFV